MLKLIIAGGRDFKDFDLLKKEVDRFLQDLVISRELDSTDTIEIVSGKQVTKPTRDPATWHGADYLGEKYAEFYKMPVKPFPADWDAFGKPAGMIRNKQMAEYGDVLIAFWDGVSRGTANMIESMKKQGKPYLVIRYKND